MKTLIFILFVFLFLPSSLFAQWEILNDGANSNSLILNGYERPFVDFISRDTGWIAQGTKLFKTTDGGKRWTSLANGRNLSIKSIDFIDSLRGWSATSEGICSTHDGGKSWEIKYFSDFSNAKVNVVNDTTVYITEKSRILKTSNGGESWFNVFNITIPDNNPISSVSFLNAEMGAFAAGLSIFRTLNGGETWQEFRLQYTDDILNVQMTENGTVYFTFHYWNSSFICRTFDSFTNAWILYKTTEFISASYYSESDNIIAWTGDSMIKSCDGGKSWAEKSCKLKLAATDEIYFYNQDIGYVIHNKNYSNYWQNLGFDIFKTTDQGENWSLMNNFPNSFVDVHFINSDKGFITGNGSVLATTDGGKNWSVVLSDGYAKSCFFTNDSNGFILTDYGINRTSDGGKSWEWEIISHLINNEKRIFFLDDQIGFITTSMNGIYKTINGGESWDFDFISYCELSGIWFSDKDNGWAVGYNGIIYRFTDTLGWEQVYSGYGNKLNKVFFTDKDTGWIAGGSSYSDCIFLKMTDGGKIWNTTANSSYYLINDFYFKNTQLGWAVGQSSESKGVVLETNDGGDHWTPILTNLSAPLKAIHFKDDVGWAVGDNGLILKMIDTTDITAAKPVYAPSGDEYLLQNYPNPFNSTTTISWQLTKSSRVTLKVLDIVGRTVVILVDEQRPQGKYETQFNAATLPKGIYFCQLNAGEFMQTRKMILME